MFNHYYHCNQYKSHQLSSIQSRFVQMTYSSQKKYKSQRDKRVDFSNDNNLPYLQAFQLTIDTRHLIAITINRHRLRYDQISPFTSYPQSQPAILQSIGLKASSN